MSAELNNTCIGKEEILNALAKVMEPEIPVLSITDLGILGDVDVEDDRVWVKIIPTFTACPAIRVIQDEIRSKLIGLGFENPVVEVDHSVIWDSNRISEAGKEKLKSIGLGTPSPHCGEFKFADVEQAACPRCGNSNTALQSPFGSTLCRSIHYCYDCHQSFERFKPL